jgi:hypothetical protein
MDSVLLVAGGGFLVFGCCADAYFAARWLGRRWNGRHG